MGSIDVIRHRELPCSWIRHQPKQRVLRCSQPQLSQVASESDLRGHWVRRWEEKKPIVGNIITEPIPAATTNLLHWTDTHPTFASLRKNCIGSLYSMDIDTCPRYMYFVYRVMFFPLVKYHLSPPSLFHFTYPHTLVYFTHK